MPRPRASRKLPASRDRVLRAAADEFAARGFAGASVDRIARRAHLNKAMIYYHFPNKQALYREVLAETFRSVGERVRQLAAGDLPPDRKIGEFLSTILAEASRRPHFPVMMLRELAEGGRHLGPETLGIMGGLLLTIRAILDEGRTSAGFRDVPLMVAYFSMVAPIIIFLVSAPVREGVRHATGVSATMISERDFVSSLQDFVLRSLAWEPGGTTADPRPRRKES
jgi:AcrR family transcriptional regulator